jgi:hypothetical protein
VTIASLVSQRGVPAPKPIGAVTGIDAGPFGIIKNHFPSNGSAELWQTSRHHAKFGQKYCVDVKKRDKSFGQQSP